MVVAAPASIPPSVRTCTLKGEEQSEKNKQNSLKTDFNFKKRVL
jgi:hypothetical protein